MPTIENEKVMIFIDGAYWYEALKHKYSRAPKIDIFNLANHLCKNGDLRRIYYYNAYPPLHSDIERYDKVQKLLRQVEQRLHKNYSEINNLIKKLKQQGKSDNEIAKELGLTDEELKAENNYYNDSQQMKYYDSLMVEGIKVKLIKLKRNPEKLGSYYQKGIDVLIASDMLSLAFRNAYGTAILISGDADYVRVIDGIQELGKRVELASFKYGKAWDLHKICDKYTELDQIIDRYKIDSKSFIGRKAKIKKA